MTDTSPHGRIPIVRTDPLGRWVVICKPHGILSVPGKGPDKQDCAASRVQAAFPAARGPLIVHRLDMDTSGLMVLGLDADAQRALSAQFESRTVGKAYIALVSGQPHSECGLVDVPMRLDVDRRPYQIVDYEHGRTATTRWRLLTCEVDRSRLRLEPETGRTHQLRVHCAHIGHPIIGDVLYDGEPADRLMLHAAELSFDDPTTRERIMVTSPAPF